MSPVLTKENWSLSRSQDRNFAPTSTISKQIKAHLGRESFKSRQVLLIQVVLRYVCSSVLVHNMPQKMIEVECQADDDDAGRANSKLEQTQNSYTYSNRTFTLSDFEAAPVFMGEHSYYATGFRYEGYSSSARNRTMDPASEIGMHLHSSRASEAAEQVGSSEDQRYSSPEDASTSQSPGSKRKLDYQDNDVLRKKSRNRAGEYRNLQ